MPGDRRAGPRRHKELQGTKGLRFASPEEVEEQMGCQIGSCYPLGIVVGLRTLVDKSLGHNETIFFNPGRHDISIKMKYADFQKLTWPEVVEVTN